VKLSKNAITLVGIGTAWIAILPPLTIASWLLAGVALLLGGNSPTFVLAPMILFLVLTLLQCPTMLLQVVLLVVFVSHIVQNSKLSDGIRAALLIGAFFFSFIVMPIYFLRFIWKTPADDSQPSNEIYRENAKPRTNRRVLIIGVGLLIAILLLPIVGISVEMIRGLFFDSPPFTTPISVHETRVSNANAHFSIAYPDNWTYLETPGNERDDSSKVAFIHGSSVLRLGVFAIIRRSTANFDTLDDLAKYSEELETSDQRRYATQAIDTNIDRTLESKEEIVKGEKTIYREYTFGQNGPLGITIMVRHCLANYRVHNRIGYSLTLCTDEDEYHRVAPTFLRMIESFAYLD
jgi:hypothetical protein